MTKSANEPVSKSVQAFQRRPASSQQAAAPKPTRVVVSDESTELEAPPDPTPPPAQPTSNKPGALPVRIYLPSRFWFYSFSEITLRPLKGHHQDLMYRAAHEYDDQLVADAITDLLPEGIRSEDLTVPDFYFIMYWLRLNCYTKTQLVHRGVCNSEKHLMEVRSGAKKTESLVTVVTIPKTWLEQTELAEDFLDGFEDSMKFIMEELSPLGYTVTPPRMYDVIALQNMKKEAGEEEIKTDTLSFNADRAACLVKEDGSKSTLAERIEIVRELSVDTLDLLDEWRVRSAMYGVKESVRFKCKECGADVENPVLLSAHAFL